MKFNFTDILGWGLVVFIGLSLIPLVFRNFSALGLPFFFYESYPPNFNLKPVLYPINFLLDLLVGFGVSFLYFTIKGAEK